MAETLEASRVCFDPAKPCQTNRISPYELLISGLSRSPSDLGLLVIEFLIRNFMVNPPNGDVCSHSLHQNERISVFYPSFRSIAGAPLFNRNTLRLVRREEELEAVGQRPRRPSPAQSGYDCIDHGWRWEGEDSRLERRAGGWGEHIGVKAPFPPCQHGYTQIVSRCECRSAAGRTSRMILTISNEKDALIRVDYAWGYSIPSLLFVLSNRSRTRGLTTRSQGPAVRKD